MGWVSNRYAIAFLSFLGLLVSVGYRTCFALVVTHITGNTSDHSAESLFPHCTTRNTSSDRWVDWDGSTTFLFHTSFFAGQFVSSFPSGLLASKYSPKWIFGGTILTSSVLFLVLPKASEVHEALIFVIRALQGIVEAMAVPSMNAFISRVATSNDKARLINIAYAGAYLSPAVAMFATGATICYVSWDSMIYIYGALGVAWSIMWLVVVERNPQRRQKVKDETTRLLQPHTEETQFTAPPSLRYVPWCFILTSLPVIAVWVGSFCRNVVFAILITEVQQYYKDVYNLSTAMIGLLSAIPHIGMSIFMIPGSIIFDMLNKKEILSMTKVRKLAQFSGYGVQGACFLAIGFIDDHLVAFTLMCVGVAFSAFAISGFQTNPLDLAPRYVGVVTGLVRTGMVGSVFSTLLASQLTGDSHSLKAWQHMFIIAGSIHLGGVLFYIVFASGSLQPWAVGDNSRDWQDTSKDRVQAARTNSDLNDNTSTVPNATVRYDDSPGFDIH